MPKLTRGRAALLIVRSLLAAGVVLVVGFAAAAEGSAEEEDQIEVSEFARVGFYVGGGGTAGFPMKWDSDIDDDLSDLASERANETATAELEKINPMLDIIPLDVHVGGADVEDTLLGINGVIGYRAGQRVAFELEGEWLIDSNKSRLDVTESNGTQSMGTHTTKVEEIWTLTANVKVFPPLTGRFQPFGVVGVGVQHSELDINIVTSGLETTDDETPLPENTGLDADFEIHKHATKLDGLVRFGGGIDVYATPNIVGQLNVVYVLPFAEVGSVLTTDYVAIVWRVLYRF